VGFFRDEATGLWRVEGVREAGAHEAELAGALALAEAASGVPAALLRAPTDADGWLARTYAGFPEQRVGRRFVVRGSHLAGAAAISGRIPLVLDAGLAFGSGEHGSTRGCLRALERVAHRKPRRVLDLGTGSGILAIAAARLLRRPVLATDIEPWSVRVARDNARQNGVGRLVRARLADGWRAGLLRRDAPYDLVLANVLARPLCRMAWPLSVRMEQGGTVILAGLLTNQARVVLSAHRRRGFRLESMLREGPWATLVLRAGGRRMPSGSGPRAADRQAARRRRAAS
jgi:ribosomal protein L11 methyltransferase